MWVGFSIVAGAAAQGRRGRDVGGKDNAVIRTLAVEPEARNCCRLAKQFVGVFGRVDADVAARFQGRNGVDQAQPRLEDWLRNI
jgi:hypothetical protein